MAAVNPWLAAAVARCLQGCRFPYALLGRKKRVRMALSKGIGLLRDLHSGYVADYVTRLLAGVAVFGAACVLAFHTLAP